MAAALQSSEVYQRVLHSVPSNSGCRESVPTLCCFPPGFPTVKCIPGTRFIVDSFTWAGPWSVSYFLSHFHSDHYRGISHTWDKGLIFCSQVTARLLTESSKVDPAFVIPLPLNTRLTIDGCQVLLLDANHCPGAVQMLFTVPGPNSECHRYVHTGDMRFSPCMKTEPALSEYIGADAVFLDTTYCNPKFAFPSQQSSVEYIVDVVHTLMHGVSAPSLPESQLSAVDLQYAESAREKRQAVKEKNDYLERSAVEGSELPLLISITAPAEGGKCQRGASAPVQDNFSGPPLHGQSFLILIATYVIGKEKILTAVANRCNCKVFVDEKKLALLKCLDLEEMDVFTCDPSATSIHVVGWNLLGDSWPYFRPNFSNMEKYMQESGVNRVIGFIPTGWNYEAKKTSFDVRRKGPLEIHLVPYSEHSNYEELREYIRFLRPKSIIPNVGIGDNERTGKATASMLKHFRNLVDETASKRCFLKAFDSKNSYGQEKSLSETRGQREMVEGAPCLKAAACPESERTHAVEISPKGEPAPTFAAPLAALGLGSRKKRRETKFGERKSCEWQGGTDQDHGVGRCIPTSQSVNAPQNLMKASTQGHLDGESYRSSDAHLPCLHAVGACPEGGTGESSGGTNALLDPLGAEITSEAKEAQLISILPEWVSKPQVQRLLVQANMDVNGALIRFFEQETMYAKEITARSQMQHTSSKGSCKLQKRKGRPPNRQQVTKNMNGLALSHIVFPEAPVQASQTTSRNILSHVWSPQPLAAKVQVDVSAKTSITTTGMGLPGKLKSASTTMPSQSKKAGAQRSILDFFGGASGPTDHCVDALPAPTTEGQCRPCVNGKVLRSEGWQQDKELNKEMNLVDGRSVWQTEIEHLVSMLEGNVSERDVEAVVSNVDGDVARAVEMVCNRSGQQVPYSLERTSSVSERTCHELEASSEEPISAETSWKEEFEPVKHIMKGSNPQQMQFSCLDASIAAPISKYIPAVHACWEKDTPAPYLHLARSFDLIEKESGRLKSTDMLCNMFRSLVALSPSDVLPAAYLTINRISPDFENREMSIGASLILKAVSEATSTPVAKLKQLYNSLGDLGDVAQACRQTQSTLKLLPTLTIHQVFSTLHQISDTSGSGSAARKKNLVFSLLRACRESETKFIVRTLVQSMRIGATLTTVLTALAHAVLLHGFSRSNLLVEESINDLKCQLQHASAALLEAYNLFPNLDVLVPRLLREGIEALSSIIMCPGTPIRPMLAKIAHGIPEVLKRFQGQAFTCEYKYDGQRAQIHLQEDGSIRIFSRDSDDTTSRFPDIVSIVQDARKPEAVSFILDSEVVAIDRDNGNKLLAFQHLSTRGRGGRNGAVIDVSSIKVQVCVFIFDIMYANGTPLVKLSFRERQKWMHDLLPNIKRGCIEFAHAIEIEGSEDESVAANRLEAFLEEAFSHSCEGFMAKGLDEDSEYAASNRSDRWLKVKRDYVEGLHDTLDLVPIGAWHGSGRKAGWYSPFLLACYNPHNDEFESVCRVMSGFSDTFYREAKEFFSGEQVLPKKPPYYRTRDKPDVWFAPKVVWEILGADLTLSPVHDAAFGLVHESRGISMRFPRFISVRIDKIAECANSPSDIVDIFHKQTRKLQV